MSRLAGLKGTWRAIYDGRCADCCEEFEQGNWIARNTDDALVHATCETQPQMAEKVGDVCPIHHVAKSVSGVCDDCEDGVS